MLRLTEKEASRHIAALLVLMFALFAIYHSQTVRGIPFNWFALPDNTEIYLASYSFDPGAHALSISFYSSKDAPAGISFCGREERVQASEGVNTAEVSTEGCPDGTVAVSLAEGGSLLRFTAGPGNRSFTSPQPVEAPATRSYDLLLPLLLISSLALAWRAGKRGAWQPHTSIITFILLPIAAFVFQFQLSNNLGFPGWLLPAVLLAAVLLDLVFCWKCGKAR